MGMVITGSGIDSAECRELRAKWRERVQQYDDMDATLVFETEDAFVDYQTNGRTVTPCLMLMGRPVSVEGEFPWDVSGVEYVNKLDRQLMAYRYEFTRENLSDLAAKGLFEPEFETPAVLRKNRFELPCTVSCVAIGPESESDFPVVFVSLNPGSLVCDDNMSGYSIHEYFDMLPEREPDDLVYESAVARTLPYETAFNQLGDKLKVPEKDETEIAAEMGVAGIVHEQQDVVPESASVENAPALEGSEPVFVSEKPSAGVEDKPASVHVNPAEKPVEAVPGRDAAIPDAPREKLDREQAIADMGEQDDNGFYGSDEDEYE